MPARRRGWSVGAAAVLCAAALAGAGNAALARMQGRTAGGDEALAAVPAAFAAHDVAAGQARSAPQRLADTGLYLADGSVDPRNRHFTPQYPLWTDGAAKSRWIRLPEGARIDVSDVDAWRFPAGTTFWKEFAWGGRRVETRMIHVSAGGEWIFATYVWNEEQTDAFLAPDEGVAAAFEFAPGRRHSIPSAADCGTCHRSSPAVVLGFSALQLSDDRDPLAPHAERLRTEDVTLRALVREDRLSPRRPELAQRPPRIRASDPVARAALGYLSANCGTCHNSRGPLARLGFSLLHDAAAADGAPEPAHATTTGAHGRFLVPGVAADSSFIVAPGAPERSALLYRMSSRRPSAQMPPLGTAIADTAAVALVRRWIERMGTPAAATVVSANTSPPRP